MTQKRPQNRYIRVTSSSNHYLIINGSRVDLGPGERWFDLGSDDLDDMRIDSDGTVEYFPAAPLVTRVPEFPEWVSGCSYVAGDKFKFFKNFFVVVEDHISSSTTPYTSVLNGYVCFLGMAVGDIAMCPDGLYTSANSGLLLCAGYTLGKVGSGANKEGDQYELLVRMLFGGTFWEDGTPKAIPDLRGLFPAFRGTSSLYNRIGTTKYSKEAGFVADQFQNHGHDLSAFVNAGGSGSTYSLHYDGINNKSRQTNPDANRVDGAITLSGDTVRSGNETYPAYYGLYPYIKY